MVKLRGWRSPVIATPRCPFISQFTSESPFVPFHSGLTLITGSLNADNQGRFKNNHRAFCFKLLSCETCRGGGVSPAWQCCSMGWSWPGCCIAHLAPVLQPCWAAWGVRVPGIRMGSAQYGCLPSPLGLAAHAHLSTGLTGTNVAGKSRSAWHARIQQVPSPLLRPAISSAPWSPPRLQLPLPSELQPRAGVRAARAWHQSPKHHILLRLAFSNASLHIDARGPSRPESKGAFPAKAYMKGKVMNPWFPGDFVSFPLL